MRYRLTQDVISPQDAISNVDVIFDGGEDSVSIARITWFGNVVVAMRWNIALREWDVPEKADDTRECLGMPVSRGYPTWFILPEEMFNANSRLSEIMRTLP
jgi:hypothetical protein